MSEITYENVQASERSSEIDSKENNLHTQYLNTLQTPVMAIDKQFTVTYMNENGAGLLGSTPEEVRGKKCYSLFKTDDCQTDKCACGQAMRKGETASSQTVSRAGGGELPIQYVGSPLYDESGEVIGAVEFVTDITDLRKVIDDSGVLTGYLAGIETPIMAIDKQFTITYMNENGAGLLGSTPEEVRGKKCYSLFKTDDCQTDKCACGQAMRKGETASSQTVSRAGGGELPIQYTGSPLYDEKGEIIGAVEFVTDVSDIMRLVKVATEVGGGIVDLSNEILESIKTVSDMGKQAVDGSQQLSNSMQQVAASSQNVSQGSQNLASIAQETATNIDELTNQMGEVNERTVQVQELATESNEASKEMAEGGQSALQSLGEISKASSDVESIIGEVNTAVKSVAGLADEISAIADQVNMLALNAAIEAARAGEAGRGFAVVADAVKQLAGQTGTAAKTAIDTIDGITSAGQKATETSQDSGKASDKGNEVVQSVVAGAEQVNEAMTRIVEIITALTSSVETSIKTLGEISGAMQQVASISEESAAASEETSASIEEQTAATEQVSAAAEKTQQEAAKAEELAQKIVGEVKRLRDELGKLTT